MEKKTKILIGLFIAAILIGLYLWWDKRNKRLEEGKAKDVVTPENIDTILKKDEAIKAAATSKFPLKMGSRSDEVKKLQIWMLKNEGFRGKIDGIWGPETDAAVKKFMKVSEISEEKYKSLGIKY